MAIEIKEYVGHKFTSVSGSNNFLNLTEGYTETYMAEDSIMVDMEAIHSRITRNNTYYSPNCLKESVPYWTSPYKVPVIMHHNEKDGHIIGRVHSTEYTEVNTRGNTPALIFTINVGDEEGKKGIKNGTLSTVSIGVIAHDLRCSICGTNLAEEGMCEHEKGEFYDIDDKQKLCYWIIEKMEPKEVSYVIVPSDAYAHNLKVYDAIKKKKSEVKESVEIYNPFADLIEATKVKTKVDVQEGKQIDEEVDKKTDVSKKEETTEDNKTTENKSEDKTEGHEDPAGEPGVEGNRESDTKTEETNEEEISEETKVTEKETKTDEEVNDDEKSKEDEASKETENNKELELAKEEIAQLKKDLEAVKQEKSKLENKLEKVTETKESVERELVKFKAEKKKQLVEQISELRNQLSLPKEDEQTLIESSEESLQTVIKNLNEFTQVQRNAFGLQTITSPVAVSESKDNTILEVEKSNKKNLNVKESFEKSNKTLEDQVINLMENLF
ncbi:MAG: hypothetical protein RR406_00265 [Bacilli bacterium]